jgi:hypothetical protein
MQYVRAGLLIIAVATIGVTSAVSVRGQEDKKKDMPPSALKKGDEVIALRVASLQVEAKTVGTVRAGDTLVVEDVQGDWLWVRSGEARGWIDARNVVSLRIRLEAQRVAIYNLVGNVRVVQGPAPDVIVEMQRGGHNANRLRTHLSDVNGRETLCIMYPGNRVVDPRSGVTGILNCGSGELNIGSGMNISGGIMMLDVREDGTFGGAGGQPVVITNSGPGLQAYCDLTVRVPPGRDVAIHVGLGKLSARDTEATLTLHSLAGDVEVSGMKRTPTITAETGRVLINGRVREPE